MHELLHQLACFRAKPKPARDVVDRIIDHGHFCLSHKADMDAYYPRLSLWLLPRRCARSCPRRYRSVSGEGCGRALARHASFVPGEVAHGGPSAARPSPNVLYALGAVRGLPSGPRRSISTCWRRILSCTVSTWSLPIFFSATSSTTRAVLLTRACSAVSTTSIVLSAQSISPTYFGSVTARRITSACSSRKVTSAETSRSVTKRRTRVFPVSTIRLPTSICSSARRSTSSCASASLGDTATFCAAAIGAAAIVAAAASTRPGQQCPWSPHGHA